MVTTVLMLIVSLPWASGAEPRVQMSGSGVAVSLASRGVSITTPADGQFVLDYPSLTDATQQPTSPTNVAVSKNKASMRYANGARLAVTFENCAVMLHFTGLPADAKGLRMDMTLPITFKYGQWQMDGAKPQPFPAQFAGEQFVFKGNPQPVKLIGPHGGAFTLSMPYGWQQMQDNRKWNTDSFAYMTATGPRSNRRRSLLHIQHSDGR